LKVVAEGVETSTQDALLKILECDEVQGFYYSHPVHPGEMTQMLMARNA
ncbi:MAG TPA: EAL domain-containing protein, partial [Sulfuricurvum sp.]|nr:EAL domain-containing protein [Sulfuricurvum sp.]